MVGRIGKPEQPEEANRFQVPIAIQMVGFSPDGKTLAASDREDDLLLLNVADWTRRAVKTSAGGRRGRGPALTFAYGGDGRLVCAGGGGSARIYRAKNTSTPVSVPSWSLRRAICWSWLGIWRCRTATS